MTFFGLLVLVIIKFHSTQKNLRNNFAGRMTGLMVLNWEETGDIIYKLQVFYG